MNLPRLVVGALSAVLLVVTSPARGQGAGESTSLGHERAAIDQRLAQEEAACYQQFSVNACLRRARRQARSDRTEVQRREAAAKDQVRRERSDRYRQETQDRQEAAAQAAAQRDMQAQPRAPRAHRPSQPAARTPRPAADQSAQAKAAEQRAKDAEQARERQLRNQRSAAERAQALQRRQAQREAKGKPRSAPLPDPY